MARSFAEWVARITIGTTHLILFIPSILSGRTPAARVQKTRPKNACHGVRAVR
jgi:hypothetical protein